MQKNGEYHGDSVGYRKNGSGIYFWDDGNMYIGLN